MKLSDPGMGLYSTGPVFPAKNTFTPIKNIKTEESLLAGKAVRFICKKFLTLSKITDLQYCVVLSFGSAGVPAVFS